MSKLSWALAISGIGCWSPWQLLCSLCGWSSRIGSGCLPVASDPAALLIGKAVSLAV